MISEELLRPGSVSRKNWISCPARSAGIVGQHDGLDTEPFIMRMGLAWIQADHGRHVGWRHGQAPGR